MDEPKRQIAEKVRIKDLIEGEYVKREGWNPNYILVNNRNISRVNIIAAIISMNPELNKLAVDDGSSSISLRSFEDLKMDYLNIGDVVLLIGRPREYNNEKYILPEIIKKVSNIKWVEVRKKELLLEDLNGGLEEEREEIPQKKNQQEEKADNKEEPAEERVEEIVEEEVDSYQEIINLIRELDQGEGADFDKILEMAKLSEGEDIINKLIEQGEVFEIKPGKLKILE